MKVVVENLVKEIVDASIEVKSISDCIDDFEYGAAKKLLKRHKKCKLKKFVKSVIASEDHKESTFDDPGMTKDEDLVAAAEVVEAKIENEVNKKQKSANEHITRAEDLMGDAEVLRRIIK